MAGASPLALGRGRERGMLGEVLGLSVVVGVAAVIFVHPLRASHASPSLCEGEGRVAPAPRGKCPKDKGGTTVGAV